MYSILKYLAQPSTLLFLFCLALWGHARFRGTELPRVRRWWAACLVLFYLYMMPAAGFFACWTLEGPYPLQEVDAADCDAIVILSGYAYRDESLPQDAVLGHDTLRRCMRGDDLARAYPDLPVVVTGGKVRPEDIGPSLANMMENFLIRIGLPEERIIREGQSSDTHQNAQNTREMLPKESRRIVLVTDALHMARAKRCFESAGFEVVPAATGQVTLGQEWSIGAFLPDANAPLEINAAAHEWAGLLWYKLRGWI